MCKCFEMIKKFRSGNRIVIESDYHRVLSLRRKNTEEPLGKLEFKNKDEVLLCDVLAVLVATWGVCRLIKAAIKLLR